MKLIITQPELEAIVRAHLNENFQLKNGAEIKIAFTATRGDDGITVTADIPYMGVTQLDLSSTASADTAKTPLVDTGAPAVAKGPAAAVAKAAVKPKGGIFGNVKTPDTAPAAEAAPAAAVTATVDPVAADGETIDNSETDAQAADAASEAEAADATGVVAEDTADQAAAEAGQEPVKPAGKSLFADG